MTHPGELVCHPQATADPRRGDLNVSAFLSRSAQRTPLSVLSPAQPPDPRCSTEGNSSFLGMGVPEEQKPLAVSSPPRADKIEGEIVQGPSLSGMETFDPPC